MDRYYQCHKDFDIWQTEEKSFVCRIRENTKKTLIKANPIKPGSIVFYDAIVLLGTAGVNQTEKQLWVIGYRVDNKVYWIATNRFALSAEEVATVYKLRWNIEIFFGWWKRHLKVYHLIARSEHGLMAQILGGLITDLLLAIYCYNHHKELDLDLPTPDRLQADTHNLKEQFRRSFAISLPDIAEDFCYPIESQKNI